MSSVGSWLAVLIFTKGLVIIPGKILVVKWLFFFWFKNVGFLF